ncbi:MAG TPA: hypothetical protein VLU46_14815 [Thermoanaerobaculia bacterium]|nr:hypothetical protein [Thermoanaerobaculia bacterium]
MFVILRLTLAAIFAMIGVAGLLLPILPGWPFFGLAVLVAFPRARASERMLLLAEPKLPRLTSWLRKNGFGVVPSRDTTRHE